MTLDTFGRWLAATYGPYEKTEGPFSVGRDVREYLSAWGERELDILRDCLLRSYEVRYGPPCVANLCKFESEVALRVERERKPVLRIEDQTEYVSPEEMERFWATFGKLAKKGMR